MKKVITKTKSVSKIKKSASSINRKSSKKATKLISNKNEEYAKFFNDIKKDIFETQLKAATSVTRELILLYWRIGKGISLKINVEKWGTKIVETLSKYLEKEFPGIVGFSLRNLRYMRTFAETYADPNIATAVAILPWGHNIVLLEKLQSTDQRLWYAQQAIENGWSRAVLIMWIESNLFKRQGKAITNFAKTLPQPDSDIAQQTLKDPYNFDFLMLEKKAREQEIEKKLMSHIQQFLLELGQGFAFVGRQYHLVVGTKDLYIDMLFYHTGLRCYIVVELKAEEFDARDVGQINVYLSAVDSSLKHQHDAPTIGLLLCKSKDNYLAEYALRNFTSPIGISSYTTQLVESLPKEFKGMLPTIAEIETELDKVKKTKPMKRTKKQKL